MDNMDYTDFHLELTPATIVIFGVTGDLSTRKLLPSLYELEKNGLLHPKTRIIGVTRRTFKTAQLLKLSKQGIRDKDGRVIGNTLKSLGKKIETYEMNAASGEGYPGLKKYLDEIEAQAGLCMNRLYYLAIPPQVSAPIITHLGENGLNHGCTKHNTLSHLLLEKPFGFDTDTAQELIAVTRKYFAEKQLFRIDHYLAKETVQNLVTFRFRNPIFEDIWDSRHIKSISVIADERLDIEGRANFYEQVGAMRDLIQSHLLNVVSVVMMNRPKDITNSDDIHAERQRVLDAIEPVPANRVLERVIRGQYIGYREEVNNLTSNVETFAALELRSRQPHWQNVPIYVRTGKALAKKQTCIVIEFKPQAGDHIHTNQLVFYIQPNESITVQLWVKKPGFENELQVAPMQFNYQQVFDTHGHPDAYERVLVDAIRGDNTLFATSEEVMASWRIIQPVLDYWATTGDDLIRYAKGSDGPDMSSLTTR